jgi:plasmid stability protein
MTATQRDARNLRRRAAAHGRSVREQAHVEGLRMLSTHRPEAVVAHLALALEVAA